MMPVLKQNVNEKGIEALQKHIRAGMNLSPEEQMVGNVARH